MKVLNTALSALVLVGATAFAAPSEAASSYRTVVNHASVACVGTNSSYQAMLTTRPEGRKNNTINPTIVQCGGVATPYNNYGDVLVYEVGMVNHDTVAMTINCALVDGVENDVVSTVYPKSVTIQPGETAWLNWDGNDTGGTTWNDGTPFSYPALNCQLPPKGEISYTALIYQVDVGN